MKGDVISRYCSFFLVKFPVDYAKILYKKKWQLFTIWLPSVLLKKNSVVAKCYKFLAGTIIVFVETIIFVATYPIIHSDSS